MLLCVAQIHCGSGHIDQDHRLAGLYHCLQKFSLHLGKQQVYLITGSIAVTGISLFPFQRLIQTQNCDHDVTVLCHSNCLADSILTHAKILYTVFEQMAAFRIIYTNIVAAGILNSFQNGRVSGSGPVIVADQSSAAVGIGSNHTDGLQRFFLQRQDSVILQKNY